MFLSSPHTSSIPLKIVRINSHCIPALNNLMKKDVTKDAKICSVKKDAKRKKMWKKKDAKEKRCERRKMRKKKDAKEKKRR